MRSKLLQKTPAEEIRHALAVIISVFIVVAVAGCAATPSRPESPGVVFQKTSDVVQKAAIDALVVTGFDIQKSEPLYVEGFRPHKVGFFVGSGGETVGIWIEPLGSSSTRVRVDTAKSLVGIVGQKNWDTEILAEMEKTLGRRE